MRPADFSARRRIVEATSRALESLEPRVLLSTTVFSDGFETGSLNDWTLQTDADGNVSTRWGLNTLRTSAGAQSAYASAIQGGAPNISGYQNNQHNALVHENVSLAGYKLASLSFDYFLNTESGYDTFSVVIVDAAGTRTTVFSESGNFAGAGWRTKSLDLAAFAGQSDLDIEFRFDSDASVTNDGGGVWIDSVTLKADAEIPPGSISGKLFDDANGNKVKESSEGALANWRVYLDQNRNGVRDASEASKLTDSSGNYSFTDLAPGTYYVAQEIASGYVQTSPGASGITTGSAFKIDVAFPDSSITPSQRAAFTEAANRWSQIIVGDLPDISDGGTIIDDLRISATAPSIDGHGGILGQAAPTGFRSGTSLPFKGFMEFDAEDLAQLESDGSLTRVILHEMAHVLGLGTLWSAKALLQGTGTSDPRFIGTAATAAYNAIFGTADSGVPVEALGGGATPGTHWRESVLGNELMTGLLNGGSNPLSQITVGSMADLGYAVSYNAADAYSETSATPTSLAMGPSIYPDGFVGASATPKGVTAAPELSVAAGASTDTTLLGYAYTVFVDTGTARTGVDFGNRTPNKSPVLTGVSDSPDNSVAGTNVTLTAAGVSDPNGSVTKVSFYRESNGVAGLQNGTGGDTPVGTDNNSSGGYTTTFSTMGLAAAAHIYYAQATDNEGVTSSAGTAAAKCTNTVKPAAANGSIAGTVFNDLNGNGVKDANEPGQSGWRVYIDANQNSAFDSTEKNVVTASSGAYSFIGLAAGTYNIREVDQSNWTRTNFSPTVTLTAGQAATGKNFSNFKNASIAGRVFNDSDRDGVQDSGEAGLAGVRVYDDKNNNGLFDTGEIDATTNSSGDYTLIWLSAGTRRVRVVLPAGRSLTNPSTGAHIVKPTSGQVVIGKRFGTRT
jgi:hypothetical protein